MKGILQRGRQYVPGSLLITRHVIETHWDPRVLSHMASYDMASNICQALLLGAEE